MPDELASKSKPALASDLPQSNPPQQEPAPSPIQKPYPQPASVGRIVRFMPENVQDDAANNGAKVVPAIVVSTFEPFVVNLQVFIDGEKGTAWKTSVKYDEFKSPGTWHWPERF